MPFFNILVVLAEILILVVALNGTPLINLAVSSCVAVPALPVTLPLILAVADKLIPACKALLKPVTELLVLIVNAAAVQIANTTPSVSKKITGRGSPTVSSKDPALALVDPNPSTASGPMNLHSVPVYTYN